jgi:ferredoxin
MAKVLADRDVCIGAGMCVMTTEVVFDQDDDALVVVLTDEVPDAERERVDNAVRLCPSGALKLQEP